MQRHVAHVLIGVLLGQSASIPAAGPGDEGLAAGRAALPGLNGMISAPNAAAVVPGYTNAPPQAALYGTANLVPAGAARLSACAANPGDPVCQAIIGATRSANTQAAGPSAYDPSVVGVRAVANNPSLTLGGLSAYYGGCTVSTVPTAATTQAQVCSRYVGVGNYRCSRALDVTVTLADTCTPGTWFQIAQVDRNALDHMYAEAYCEPNRADGLQKFRFYASGGNGACIGWQTVELPTAVSTAPRLVTQLSPHWQGFCWSPFDVVAASGSGCTGTSCKYQFEFGSPVVACPAGSVPGNTLFNLGQPIGSASSCYTARPTASFTPCAAGQFAATDSRGVRYCAASAGTAQVVGASGWTVPLGFTKPGLTATEADTWNDLCPNLAAAGRCSIGSGEVCVDGPSTKNINGIEVTRACWQYQRSLTCGNGAPTDQCAPLVAAGCTKSTSACARTDPSTDACQLFQDTYQCPVAAGASTSVSACPPTQFCIAGTCFPTTSVNDPDFAHAMSYVEAAREAGTYLDVDNLRVFSGEQDNCRQRLLANCCSSNAAGRGMSNQRIFGGRSSMLVFDLLMNSGNRSFIADGIKALLTGSGFPGTFSSYGISIAVDGAPLPAGAVEIGASADGSVVLAVDPWSLAVTAMIYVVMSMGSCNTDEAKTAMKEGAHLCHTVGSWCSNKVLGTCLEHTTSKCCFNSVLARIINEQGRGQVGKGWGASAQNPDCSGFTVAQLQKLNFAAMDLSEFYASISPTLPNVTAVQAGNASRAPACYFGQGRCQ